MASQNTANNLYNLKDTMSKTLHMLALTAFFLGITAPACGFAWGGKYSIIEICTADGYESRIVQNDQEPDGQAPQMSDQCQFCFMSSHLTGLTLSSTTIEGEYAYELKQAYALYEVILLSRLTSYEQPRGPPSFV